MTCQRVLDIECAPRYLRSLDAGVGVEQVNCINCR
jgi:hypothetical protein